MLEPKARRDRVPTALAVTDRGVVLPAELWRCPHIAAVFPGILASAGQIWWLCEVIRGWACRDAVYVLERCDGRLVGVAYAFGCAPANSAMLELSVGRP